MNIYLNFKEVSTIVSSFNYFTKTHGRISSFERLFIRRFLSDYESFKSKFSSLDERERDYSVFISLATLDELSFLLECLTLYRVSLSSSPDDILDVDSLYSRLSSSVISTRFVYGY